MQEFLRSALQSDNPLNWGEVALRIGLAIVLGMAVAGIYRATRPKAYVTPSFPITLVLLSALIAMVTRGAAKNRVQIRNAAEASKTKSISPRILRRWRPRPGGGDAGCDCG